MNLNCLDDATFLNFIESIDENLRKYATDISRHNNQVVLKIIPKKENKVCDVLRLFKFTNDSCLFEFGCIKLDFTSHWQKYIENITNLSTENTI